MTENIRGLTMAAIRKINMGAIRRLTATATKGLTIAIVAFAIMACAAPFVGAPVHGAGLITCSNGQTFTNFDEAFSSLNDGDEVTMTVSGDIIYAKDNENSRATLTQNAKVTILAGSSESVIKGVLGVDGSGTLIIGKDDPANKLNIQGGLFADSGTLETRSEMFLTSTDTTSIGIIQFGKYEGTASVTGRINGGTIVTGSGVTNNQSCIRVNGSGTRVEYIKGATISSTTDKLEEGAIAVKSNAQVGLIENCNITSANHQAIALGSFVNVGRIDKISNCDVKSGAYGILLYPRSSIGDIEKTNIEVNNTSGNGTAVYSRGGKIDNIVETGIKVEASGDGVGIAVDPERLQQSPGVKGSIGTIDKVNIDVSSGGGAFGLNLREASVETVSNSTINATCPGRLYGINMQPGRIDYIRDSEINVHQKSQSSTTFVVYQVGPVKEVTGCTMRATGANPTRLGYNVLNDPLFATEGYEPRLDLMKDTKIVAGGYALGVQQDGTLGVLSGNHFYSSYSSYGCIYLSVGGEIEEIKSGTYASSGSGVYINYGSRPGPSGKYNSSLKKISFEEVEVDGKATKQGPIFYGETGWAINANTRGPAPTINVEKDKVEADQPLKGYARYYGGASKTGGLNNGDAEIGNGTADRAVSNDIYPTYHDSAADGTAEDPSEYLYFMSNKGTDSNVSDEVLKDFAGIDISGKTFHYLTVKARLKYDPNDEDGGPEVADPSVMDGDEVLDEYNTSHPVAENKYTRESYIFKEWNTEKDGSGLSYNYDPDHPQNISLENARTVLYAIWESDEPDPTDTTDPSNPTDPTDPTDPTVDPTKPADPTDPAGPTNRSTGKDRAKKNSAETGDDMDLAGMIGIMTLGIIAFGALSLRRRKVDQ